MTIYVVLYKFSAGSDMEYVSRMFQTRKAAEAHQNKLIYKVNRVAEFEEAK